MTQVTMLEAKTNLSRLIHILESKEEESIIIARGNKPVAKIVLYDEHPVESRIGIAKGKLPYNDAFDDFDSEISSLFDMEDLQ